jgi:AcrR family transcriptional regulator
LNFGGDAVPDAKGRPSPSRGEARERAILDAARELIVEIGYDRITVDAIAQRAGASKATMYRRWPGKAELVADALQRTAADAAPGIPDTGSLRGDLLATVGDIGRSFVGERGPSLLGLTEAIRHDATLRDVVRTQVRARSEEVGALIGARAAARTETGRPDAVGRLIGLAFAELFLATLLEGQPPSHADQERLVDDVLLPLLTGGPTDV